MSSPVSGSRSSRTVSPSFFPGSRIELEEPQAAVEEVRAAGDEVGDVLLDQHAAVDRPDRFELLESHQPAIQRRGANRQISAPSLARRQ